MEPTALKDHRESKVFRESMVLRAPKVFRVALAQTAQTALMGKMDPQVPS
jgi:hypothetical protein